MILKGHVQGHEKALLEPKDESRAQLELRCDSGGRRPRRHGGVLGRGQDGRPDPLADPQGRNLGRNVL